MISLKKRISAFYSTTRDMFMIENNFNFKSIQEALIFYFVIVSVFTGCNQLTKEDGNAAGFDSRQLLSYAELVNAKRFADIEKALTSKDTVFKLIIFGKNLEEIPQDIEKLEFLNSLDLSRNKIKNSQGRLAGYKYLQSLYLDHNLFEQLPPEIAELKNLKRISLADNQIEVLDSEILSLTMLEHIDFNRNKLKNLPNDMSGLIKLKSIKLSNNSLTEIPFSLENFKDLKSIDLSYNKLTNLPKGIEKLANLKKLDLVGNFIPKDSIKELLKLCPKSLHIKY